MIPNTALLDTLVKMVPDANTISANTNGDLPASNGVNNSINIGLTPVMSEVNKFAIGKTITNNA